MENNKYIQLIFLLLFILIPVNLFSEDTSNVVSIENDEKVKIDDIQNKKQSFFLKESEAGEPVLVQRLSWDHISDISGYEFVLEQQDKNNGWKEIKKEFLNDNFKDVTLPPGRYRFKVAVINLLDQLEEYSKYRAFDIRIAYQPKVTSISPSIVYFDEISTDIITVTGKNLHNDTVFCLLNKKDSKKKIYGTAIEISGKKQKQAKIKFNINKIPPDSYTVYVLDPSQLNDKSKEIVFKFQKPVDFYISTGYAFTFFKSTLFNTYLNSNISPYGGILRLSCMFIKRIYGTFGINLTTSISKIKNKPMGRTAYHLSSTVSINQIHFAYIVPIVKRRLNFGLHLGMTSIFFANTQFVFENKIKSPKKLFWGLGISAGTAFQVYLYKKLYLEINVDHLIPIKKYFPEYIIQPSLSMGWEF